jgi:hypothetical protein
MRYSIVLLKTGEKLSPNYFSGLTKDDLLFVNTIKVDSAYLYVLGAFYNKSDALKYQDYARKKGLDKSYILDQYDLENESEGISNPDETKTDLNKSGQRAYTIQVKATRNQLNINKVFNGLDGVIEEKANDGFYKYYYGEFKTLLKAKEALLSVKNLGFEDAFIRNLY